jgi:hypothetical protein
MVDYAIPAHLGSFVMPIVEGPEPGSDTGWNRQISYAQNRNLGSQRDTMLQMALGSHTREFVLNLSQARFLTLQAIQGATMTFTDWYGDSRTVLVQSIERQSGSRPFLVKTRVNLLEQ